MATKVNVIIYRMPDKGAAAHWAIWLSTPREDRILQVGGDTKDGGYFVHTPMKRGPDTSDNLKITIHCGTVPAMHNIDSLVDTVNMCPVNNESSTWNCQNWVTDALEALKSKGLTIPRDVKDDLKSRRENPKYHNPQAGKAGRA